MNCFAWLLALMVLVKQKDRREEAKGGRGRRTTRDEEEEEEEEEELGGGPPQSVRRVMKYELHGNRNIVSDINAKGYYVIDGSAIL